MIKKLKKRKTTRRKFISGIGLISAGIILRPLSLFSQEEIPEIKYISDTSET